VSTAIALGAFFFPPAAAWILRARLPFSVVWVILAGVLGPAWWLLLGQPLAFALSILSMVVGAMTFMTSEMDDPGYREQPLPRRRRPRPVSLGECDRILREAQERLADDDEIAAVVKHWEQTLRRGKKKPPKKEKPGEQVA